MKIETEKPVFKCSKNQQFTNLSLIHRIVECPIVFKNRMHIPGSKNI